MPIWIRIVLSVVLILLIGFLSRRWLIQLVSPVPNNLGVADGRLVPCPDSPNCVSSFSDDAEHAIDPIPYTSSTDAAQKELLDVIRATSNAQIITVEPNYVHVEFRSPFMGYIDDAEFLFDEKAGLIHLRSAARLGYSDLGANRGYMKSIRASFID